MACARGGNIEFEAEAIALDDLSSEQPAIRYRQNGRESTMECDFIGCDGFHGVSRLAIPQDVLKQYDASFRSAGSASLRRRGRFRR